MSQNTACWTFAESFESARDCWHLALIFIALLPAAVAAYAMLGNEGSLGLGSGAKAQRVPLPYMQTASVLKRKSTFLSASTHTRWRIVRIRSGETLADIFANAGIPSHTLRSILGLGSAAARLSDLRPNRFLQLRQDGAGRLVELHYDLDAGRYLDVIREGRRFEAQIVSRPAADRLHVVTARIKGSLYEAARRAGMGVALTTKLVHLYKGHIDFRHDTRRGDSFKVLYEGAQGRGQILAADINMHGTPHQVFRFPLHDLSGSYYAEDGEPLRSGFLRAPLNYERISSRFSYHRMNPVLHVLRPHYGVDYAAPIGTPVKAAADGKIIFRGRGGGYGRLIVIRSYERYKTYYAHLHRFAKNISSGNWVHQGEIIGYVGESGIATGPHLHFGIQVNGVWKNPLTVALPTPRPLPRAELARFRRHISPFLAALDEQDGVQSAKSSMVAVAGHDRTSQSGKSAPNVVAQVR